MVPHNRVCHGVGLLQLHHIIIYDNHTNTLRRSKLCYTGYLPDWVSDISADAVFSSSNSYPDNESYKSSMTSVIRPRARATMWLRMRKLTIFSGAKVTQLCKGHKVSAFIGSGNLLLRKLEVVHWLRLTFALCHTCFVGPMPFSPMYAVFPSALELIIINSSAGVAKLSGVYCET